MLRRRLSRLGLAVFFLCIAFARVAHADNCSGPGDCEATAGYNATVAIVGGLLGLLAAGSAASLTGLLPRPGTPGWDTLHPPAPIPPNPPTIPPAGPDLVDRGKYRPGPQKPKPTTHDKLSLPDDAGADSSQRPETEGDGENAEQTSGRTEGRGPSHSRNDEGSVTTNKGKSGDTGQSEASRLTEELWQKWKEQPPPPLKELPLPVATAPSVNPELIERIQKVGKLINKLIKEALSGQIGKLEDAVKEAESELGILRKLAERSPAAERLIREFESKIPNLLQKIKDLQTIKKVFKPIDIASKVKTGVSTYKGSPAETVLGKAANVAAYLLLKEAVGLPGSALEAMKVDQLDKTLQGLSASEAVMFESLVSAIRSGQVEAIDTGPLVEVIQRGAGGKYGPLLDYYYSQYAGNSGSDTIQDLNDRGRP